MTIERVPGTTLKYHLIAFDAAGREQSEGGTLASQVAGQELANEPVTDVFLMSHGWQGDVPAAHDQYCRWIGAMARCSADIERTSTVRKNFRSLLVGFHWPSLPWGNEQIVEAASFSPGAGDSVDSYARRLGDTPTTRSALETIFAAATALPTSNELPPEVKAAYNTLDRESGMGSGGVDAPPGADREPFNPQKVFQATREMKPGATPSFGLSLPSRDDILSPLRSLSFWKMKDRARQIGEGSGNLLLSSLQQAAGVRDVRFHLMGHSFGCIVVSAMLNGPNGSGGATRPVDSLALVQGALSLWSFCDAIPKASGAPGYFRNVVAAHRVRGPVVTTQSRFDTAVGRWYPLAAGVAGQVVFDPFNLPKYGGVGKFGIQGVGPILVGGDMLTLEGSYGFEAGKVYNLAGDQFIRNGSGFSGAHSDIDKPEVAHAIWEAALVPL